MKSFRQWQEEANPQFSKLETSPGVPAFREYTFKNKFFTPGRPVLKGQKFGNMLNISYKDQKKSLIYPVKK